MPVKPAGAIEIPFCVGKFTGVSLTRQIADGIRSAIESGYYKAGQVLPTRKEFARALGVSERTIEGQSRDNRGSDPAGGDRVVGLPRRFGDG